MGSVSTTAYIARAATTSTLQKDLQMVDRGSNFFLLEQSPYLLSLMTILRNVDTDSSQFGMCVDKVAHLVISSGEHSKLKPGHPYSSI